MKKRTSRILIVDDQHDDLDTMRKILSLHQFDVTCATGSKQALEILKKNKFELILIDIIMPELSGYDLLKIIRHKYKHKIKLIYVSIVPRKEVDMTGADGFIQKPVTPDELVTELQKTLR